MEEGNKTRYWKVDQEPLSTSQKGFSFIENALINFMHKEIFSLYPEDFSLDIQGQFFK